MLEIRRDLVKEIIKYICVNILVESETHKLINEFLNDPWNHNSLQSWTTMLKTFFAIFSLAVFLLIQTTESHHMFRWELSQNKIFKIAFLKETFLRILWDQSCQNILNFIIYRGVGPGGPGPPLNPGFIE